MISPNKIHYLKTTVHQTFPYLCPLIYFLKLEASHSESSIFVDQHKYTQDLVGLVEVRDFATFDTPMELNARLFFDDGDLFDDPTHFRTIDGSLNYLTITQPDTVVAAITLLISL